MRRRAFLATVAGAAFPALAQGGGLRIAVISDLNGSYGSTDYGADVDSAVAHIVELAPDLVICTGDMVAGQKTGPHLTEPEVAAMWTAFHAQVSDPIAAAGVPMLVTPGNHDASAYPGFELERRLFDETWTRRAPEVVLLDGERYPFRYAASFGEVLFLGLDVTVPGPLVAEEMDWIAQILREESARHRATIVFGHLPIWPVSEGREREVIADPDFRDLLAANGVAAYLCGHHHAFLDSTKGGLRQIAQPCLGGGPRRLLGAAAPSSRGFTQLSVDARREVVSHMTPVSGSR
jgi:3',5'-cyclic AMP phosphodiesterase CpdA